MMPLQDGPDISHKLSRNKVPSRQRIVTFDLDGDDDSWWIDRLRLKCHATAA